MDDFISRQEAIDAILGEPPEAHYPSWYAEIIQALPAQEIILCKYCRWSREPVNDTLGNVPELVCITWDGWTDADGYCHEAKRREDEN